MGLLEKADQGTREKIRKFCSQRGLSPEKELEKALEFYEKHHDQNMGHKKTKRRLKHD